MFKRPPDFVIGDAKDPYLLRWWVIPRNYYFNIYLHKFLRSDDPRALHDNPWHNISIIFKGGYWEHLPGEKRIWRGLGVRFRKAEALHRIELSPNHKNTWALFLTGPVIRSWGFQCAQGWVHWKQFVSFGENGESLTKGCSE